MIYEKRCWDRSRGRGSTSIFGGITKTEYASRLFPLDTGGNTHFDSFFLTWGDMQRRSAGDEEEECLLLLRKDTDLSAFLVAEWMTPCSQSRAKDPGPRGRDQMRLDDEHDER